MSLRLGSRHQGRIACASDRGDGLGAGARTLAAFCRDAVQRRRLGDDGSGRSQCDRRAVVRVRKRPTALTAAYNGSSIGGVVFSPLWVAAIGLLGFPWAAIAIGLVVVATIWTLADLYYCKTPETMGLCPDGDATWPQSSQRRRLSRCRKRRFGRIGGSSHLRRAWRSACSRRSAYWPICSPFSVEQG